MTDFNSPARQFWQQQRLLILRVLGRDGELWMTNKLAEEVGLSDEVLQGHLFQLQHMGWVRPWVSLTEAGNLRLVRGLPEPPAESDMADRVLFKRETTFGATPPSKPKQGAQSQSGTISTRFNCPQCGCGISLEIDVPPRDQTP